MLLVEDEAVNREIARAFLEHAGLKVVEAADGLQALERIVQGPVDLVLMDMQMPRMDGLEATRRMRADPAVPRVPILAMTANAFAEDRERCLAAGMDDFITKPIKPDKFFQVLLKWMSGADDRAAPAVTTPPPDTPRDATQS